MILEALREIVGPPFVIGVLCILFAKLLRSQTAVPISIVVAFAFAFASGNYLADLNPEWWPTSKRATWLPWLAVSGAVCGLLARRWPLLAGSLWTCVAAIAVVRILAKDYYTSPLWAVPAFVLLPTLTGFGLMKRDQQKPGFAIPLVMGLSLIAAGIVIIHAHSKSLMDVLVIGGICLMGFALVCAISPFETGAIMPGASLLLSTACFAGYHETFSEVPPSAFWLPAVAPGLLLIGFLPFVDRLRPRTRIAIQILPPLIVLGIALGLAMSHETLTFEDPF